MAGGRRRWVQGQGGALELNLGAPSPQMEEYERKQFCLERSRNRAGPGGLSSHPADVSIPPLQAEPRGLHPVPSPHSPPPLLREKGPGRRVETGAETDTQTGWQKASVPGGSEKERKPSVRIGLERTSVRKTEKDAQREHSGEQVMYSLSTPPAPTLRSLLQAELKPCASFALMDAHLKACLARLLPHPKTHRNDSD